MDKLVVRSYNISGCDRPINDVKFNYDGDLFLCAGADSLVRLFRSSDVSLIGTFSCGAAVRTVNFSPDSKTIICGTTGSMVEIFSLHPGSEGKKLGELDTEAPFTVFADLIPNTTNLYVISWHKKMGSYIQIFDMEGKLDKEFGKLKPVYETSIEDLLISAACFAPNGQGMIIGTQNGLLLPMTFEGDCSPDDIIFTSAEDPEKAAKCPISSVKLSPNRACVVVADRGKNCVVLSADENLDIVKGIECPVQLNAAVQHPRVPLLMTCGGDDAATTTQQQSAMDVFNVHFYDSISTQQLGELTGPIGPLLCMEIDRFGYNVVAGGHGGTLHFWKLPLEISKYVSRT